MARCHVYTHARCSDGVGNLFASGTALHPGAHRGGPCVEGIVSTTFMKLRNGAAVLGTPSRNMDQ
jgi:hypothetical protein